MNRNMLLLLIEVQSRVGKGRVPILIPKWIERKETTTATNFNIRSFSHPKLAIILSFLSFLEL